MDDHKDHWCEICEETDATRDYNRIGVCDDCWEGRPGADEEVARDPERNETELKRVTRERDEWRDLAIDLRRQIDRRHVLTKTSVIDERLRLARDALLAKVFG